MASHDLGSLCTHFVDSTFVESWETEWVRHKEGSHLFLRHLLRTYYVPDVIPGALHDKKSLNHLNNMKLDAITALIWQMMKLCSHLYS